jgi:aldehyde:ferredoxin oxidoreductase
MEEPIRKGPYAGEVLHREKWDQMLDDYYELHGWDKETGWQTRQGLRGLGLEEVAEQLDRAGKLGKGTNPPVETGAVQSGGKSRGQLG